MTEAFQFQLTSRVLAGLGRSLRLGEFLREQGFKRPLVLLDEGVARHSPYWPQVREVLFKAAPGLHVETLSGSEEPDYDYLDQVAATVRGLGGFDLVVGIGGGSCMDMAKAVAMLLTNPGRGIEYRGFDKVTIPPVPSLLAPTTAGTGSEATINAVFTDKAEKRKLGINGRHMHAGFALLDAEWTLSCPLVAAVSSGMDALTHALESFCCRQHNSLTRMYSREAFRLLYRHLPCLVTSPTDKDKRQQLLLASHIAGIGLFNSGSGIAGAFSYPIGVHFKVPHGMGGAIFLASVAEYNVQRGYTDFAELLDLVEPHPDWSAEQKSRRFAEALRQLADTLGVPRTLTRWGLTRANADEVAALLLPLQAAFNQNPVPFSAETDARELLLCHVE